MVLQEIEDMRVKALVEKGIEQGRLSFEELISTMSASDYDEEKLEKFYDMIEEIGIEIEPEKNLGSNVIDFEIGRLVHELKQMDEEER